jgi:hypothetical protein
VLKSVKELFAFASTAPQKQMEEWESSCLREREGKSRERK